MSDATAKDLLDEALATVKQGEQHLVHQRAVVAYLKLSPSKRFEAAAAKALLRSMEESQALRVARVERLRAQLG